MKGLVEELGVPKKYIQTAETEDLYIVVAHKKWLNNIVRYRKLGEFIEESSIELGEELGTPWNKIFVRVFKKSDSKVIPLPRIRKYNDNNPLLFCQLKQYIYQANCKNLWKEAHQKYNSEIESNKETVITLMDYTEVLKEIITRIYQCPIINVAKPHENLDRSERGDHCHLNLFPALCAIETLNNIFILHSPFIKHNLKDCVTFTPALLDKYLSKPLFIVYQLLNILKYMHDSSLTLGEITISDIYLSEDMWLHVFPAIASNIYPQDGPKPKMKHDFQSGLYDKVQITTETLEKTCQLWIDGQISNFTYITVLNNLSGRKFGDPNCHHVFPWVTDFSSRFGDNWRDFRKSKYRINKGDRQLDLTYENSLSQVPHHVSDVLSSITYYVYMARRTPKSVLCRNVRTVWVPAEYPSSIQRLQEWTPDECIPEFFSDPAVFRSIHEDLEDLEVPPWCSSPEEFVELHREALESAHVSERLHHWIDLTFGYKLSGSAAVKAKNVCLNLVDEHEELTKSGVVQLFAYPHPPKKTSSLFFNKTPPKYTSKLIKHNKQESAFDDKHEVDDSDDFISLEQSPNNLSSRSRSSLTDDQINRGHKVSNNQRSASLGPKHSSSKQKNSSNINLPKDYKPEYSLEMLEKRHLFLSKTFHIENAAHVNISHDSTTQAPALNKDSNVQNAFTNFIFSECFEEQIGKDVKSYFDNKRKHRKPFVTSKIGDKVVICNYSERISMRRIRELQVLGCLIIEIFMAKQLRALGANEKMGFNDRLKACLTITRSCRNEIPSSIVYITEMLLRSDAPDFRYTGVMEFGLPSPSPHFLLEPLLTFIIPFPSCFYSLYALISNIKKFKSAADELDVLFYFECKGEMCSDYEALEKTKIQFQQNIGECLVKDCIKNIENLFDVINTPQNKDCIYILLPHIKQLIEDPVTSVLAAWYLFDPIARVLGPDKACSALLQSVLKLYDCEINERMLPHFGKIAKLYHHSFLLRLIIRLGLKRFLDNFIVPLVEAVGCCKDFDKVDFVLHSHCKKICKKNAHLKTMQMDEDSNSDFEFSTSKQRENVNVLEPEIFEFDDEKQDEAQLSLIMEHLDLNVTSDSNNSKPPDEALDATIAENLEQLRNLEELKINLVTDDLDQTPGKSLNSSPSPYSEFNNISCDVGSKIAKNFNDAEKNQSKSRNAKDVSKISDISSDSLIWLSHRLGPVLTARYLSRNLLKMLTLCYVGTDNLTIVQDSKGTESNSSSFVPNFVLGDKMAARVVECLTNITGLYGEPFILFQYIPHMSELIALCKRKISLNLEAGLISCLALLQHVIPLLSDSTLMDQLQDTILKNLLHPVVRLLGSTEHAFPSGHISRNALARKYISTLHHISLRVGADMTRAHLTVPALQRFFLIFDKVHNCSSPTPVSESETDTPKFCEEDANQPLKELCLVFTPELAHRSYLAFLRHLGVDSLEISLKNHGTIKDLCQAYERDQESDCQHFKFKQHVSEDSCISKSSSIGSNIALIGNRIDVQNVDPKPANPDYVSFISGKTESNNRHLRGNWLAYWEHEIGRSDKDLKFNFKQIKLQTFVGHTGSVKSLYSLDNENSFMSGGRDKTVKLWSIRNQGDGSNTTNCQWTYTAHKKSVLSITFIESMRLVASCDSVVHIWDPFMGVSVKCLESPKYVPVNIVKYMPPPSCLLFAATTEGTIKIIDTKLCSYVQELKMSINPLGLIRCLAISPSGLWIGVGQSSGNITILDTRTGLVLTTWRAHEGEVLQLIALDNDTIISSSLDQSIAAWDTKDGKFKFSLRGPTEPIHCLNVYNNELISGSTANRIGVHTSIDAEASFSSTKLKADTFKGLLTSMMVLPLNKLLLLGSDTGNINLLC